MKTKVTLLKFFALIISCLFLSCSSSQDETTRKDSQQVRTNKNRVAQGTEKTIGVINTDGTFTITASISEIKDIFKRQLMRDSLSVTLSQIDIKKDYLEGTTDIYYYLIGSNSDGTVKIATELYQSQSAPNVLVASMAQNLILTFTSTCTCSGSCTRGCDPRHWTDAEGMIAWRCSACTQAGKTCNKSVSDSD